jgi:ATP-binding cassette subfamily C (CFTR/MRP) protein 1
MAFFDTTPIGRIVNRFSKDCYVLDEQLMSTLRSYLATMANVFSTLIVISTVTPMFLVCLIPLVIFYAMQQEYFTATYRELKRLDSVSRSPLYALLGETIDGVATIRSYGAQETLSRRLGTDLDNQQHAYFLTSASQCWLAVRLELVGTLVITFACLCSVLQHGKMGGNETFAGLAGLSISFSLSVTQSLNWAVRMASDFEANMVSVERIDQYCKLPSEAPRECEADASLPPSWPSAGEIEFVQTKLRYRQGLPLVLKGLDIHIPARSKVGVVGRTGAGKSTLMTAILRIVELDSGRILIDGVDIRRVGLAKLRSKIAVIPQDPVLFSVSLTCTVLYYCISSSSTEMLTPTLSQ